METEGDAGMRGLASFFTLPLLSDLISSCLRIIICYIFWPKHLPNPPRFCSRASIGGFLDQFTYTTLSQQQPKVPLLPHHYIAVLYIAGSLGRVIVQVLQTRDGESIPALLQNT